VRLRRRTFLHATSALGVAGALPGASLAGCSNETKFTPPRIPQEVRTLHVRLPSGIDPGKLTLVVGAHRTRLQPHTDASRRDAASHAGYSAYARAGRAPTHFAKGVSFSTQAAQSLVIRAEDGTPVLAGIRVPSQALARVLASRGERASLFQREREVLGAGPASASADAELQDVVDERDAVLHYLFHLPGLITLQGEAAAAVLVNITDSAGFGELVALADKYPAGGAGPRAWVKGVPLRNPDGSTIFFGTDRKIPAYTWVYDAEFETLAGRVANDALARCKNDVALASIKYFPVAGVHNQLKKSALAETIKANLATDREADFQQGIRARIDEATENGLKGSIENHRFCYVGLYVLYFDAAGKALDRDGKLQPDKQPAQPIELGLCSPINTAAGVPRGPSKLEFEFELPEAAARAQLITEKLSLASADPELDKYGGFGTASLLSVMLNMIVPSMLLGIGALIDAVSERELESILTQSIRDAAKELAKDVTKGTLYDIFKTFLVTVRNTGDGQPIKIAELAIDLLKTIGGECFAFLLKYVARFIAEALIELAIPFFGVALKVLATATDFADILETIREMATGTPLAALEVRPSHAIEVALLPDPKAPGGFSPLATSARVLVSFPGALPIVFDRLPFPSSPAGPYLLGPIPRGGEARVEVQLLARGNLNDVVGYGDITASNVSADDKRLVFSVPTKARPFPISARTQFGIATVTDTESWVGANQVTWSPVTPRNRALSLTVNSSLRLVACTQNLEDDTANETWNASIRTGPVPQRAPSSGGTARSPFLDGFQRQATREGRATHVALELLGGADGAHFAVTPAGFGGFSLRKLRLENNVTRRFPADWTELSAQPELARFRSKRLRQVRVHPNGYVIAASADRDVLEVIDVGKAQRMLANGLAAPFADLVSSPGERVGLLRGVVGVAPLRSGNGFLVLEQGNARISAFSDQGALLPLFNGSPVLAMRSSASYVGFDVDAFGYIFTLSYRNQGAVAGDYALDIYDPSGTLITTTPNVMGSAIALDYWRVVVTTGGFAAEPSQPMMLWLPFDVP
jgi:hypothetical protein